MKKKLLLILLCFLICCSGNNKKYNTLNKNRDKSSKNNQITVKSIDTLRHEDYALSKQAIDSITIWTKYKELSTQIDYLKKGDLSFYKGESKAIQKLMTDLEKTLPNNFTTPSIRSRLRVVSTYMLLLNDNLTLSNISIEKKISAIQAVLGAFSNLNLQINKKLEFDTYNNIISPNISNARRYKNKPLENE